MGFTLIEIMIVVLIIGIILMIATPSFLKARETSQAKACRSQLRETQYAKEHWAMNNRKQITAVATWDDLYPMYLKKLPTCPAGGTFTIGAVNDNPTCSIGGSHVLE